MTVEALKRLGHRSPLREMSIEAGEAILAGQLIFVESLNADNNNIPFCLLAGTTRAGKLNMLVALHDMAQNESGLADHVAVVDYDTSALAVGDPIYLSATLGGYSTVPVANADGAYAIVGSVIEVAVAGFILINTHAAIWYKASISTTDGYLEAAGSGLADGDYGDITVSGGGTVMTLDLTLDQILAPVAAVDFNNQQATSFRIENRTSDPGAPTEGQIWLRTDL